MEGHRLWITAASGGTDRGYRARCSCGWRSPFQLLDFDAEALARAHAYLKGSGAP